MFVLSSLWHRLWKTRTETQINIDSVYLVHLQSAYSRTISGVQPGWHDNPIPTGILENKQCEAYFETDTDFKFLKLFIFFINRFRIHVSRGKNIMANIQ